MAVTSIARLAARAPIPILPLVGAGARHRVQDLLLRPELKLTASPRHASILLIAGELPSALIEAAARVHDQIPPPRAAAVWLADREASRDLPPAIELTEPDPVPALIDMFRELMLGRSKEEPPILPDEPPAPWKGIGPHGQGGEGMMGGKPYGRPMPEMGHGRDGLMLDEVPLKVGPFLPGFPSGLALDLTLRGDVVEGVTVAPNPFVTREGASDRERRGPVSIAEFELCRAEHHLRVVAEALHVMGPVRLARALLVAASDPLSHGARISRMRRHLSAALRWTARDVASIAGDAVEGKGLGWVARASGCIDDARADDPAYRSLGFEPIVRHRGDALARFEQLLDEAAQGVDLARRAGDATADPDAIERLHGASGGGASPHLLALIPRLLEGLEWGDALTALMSLGVDLEDAAEADQAVVPG